MKTTATAIADVGTWRENLGKRIGTTLKQSWGTRHPERLYLAFVAGVMFSIAIVASARRDQLPPLFANLGVQMAAFGLAFPATYLAFHRTYHSPVVTTIVATLGTFAAVVTVVEAVGALLA